MRPAFVAGLFLTLVFAGCAGLEKSAPAPAPDAGLPPLVPRLRGVVVASNPLAAEAGAAALREGGNALDAAAAVQWALNVVEPPMSGLGGGTFMIVRFAHNGTVLVYDGREKAPAAATPDQWMTAPAQPARAWQGLAVGVPGTLALHERVVGAHGRLPFSKSFDAAIRLAEDGFPVNRDLSEDILLEREKLSSWRASAEVFLPGSVCEGEYGPCRGGRAPLAGDRLVQADLAKTFRQIQTQGTQAFYGGEIGAALVKAQSVRGGRMGLTDMAAYEVELREPLRGLYAGFDVYTMPPPGSGLTVLQILGLVEPFDLKSSGLNTGASLHLMLEAAHLAYADRAAFVADPAYLDIPSKGLLDPGYLDQRRALIKKDGAMSSAAAGDPWTYENRTGARSQPSDDEQGAHTTHFTIVDTEGNVVAVTTTIESLFGTGMVVPGQGFLMNNELTDFSASPGGANEVRPGKRPLSAMSPTIVVRDGQPMLALGSPGGMTIIWSVAQVLLNVLEHERPLSESVSAPRIYSFRPGTPYSMEPTIPAASVVELQRLGHGVGTPTPAIGTVNAAMRTSSSDDWLGVFDGRRQGGVAYVAPSEVRIGS